MEAFHPKAAKAAFLWFLALSPAAVFAQTSQVFYNPAGQAYSSDYSTYSARTAVWGPAFTGVADDASALFSNPAGLAFLPGSQAGLHSYFGLLDAVGETAVLGLPMGDGGGVGFAGSYMDYGTFEGRDAAGSLTPNYGANRINFQAGGGKEILKGISLGAAFHFSQQNIAGSGYNLLAADLGFLWKPAKGWRAGLDYLPPGLTSPSNAALGTLKAGASWQGDLDSSTHLLAAVGDSVQSNTLDYLQAGAEVSYRSTCFLRAGYRFSFNDNGADGFSGFSIGAGLSLADFELDYAYTPADWVSNSNRFSLTYFWGQEGENPGSTSKPGNPGKGGNSLSTAPMGKNATLPSGSSGSSSSVVTVFAQPPRLEDTVTQNVNKGGNPNRLTLHFNIPTDYTSQGNQMQEQGHLGEAAQLYQQALQQDPQDVLAWWGLGNAYYKLGQKSGAVTCFEKVLQLKPGNKALADWLGQYKAQQP